jgi:hypothetical protein
MADSFTLQKNNIFAVPIIHYNMEMAAQVRLAFQEVKPDCVAVELAETMQLQLLHGASRLPDLSVVTAYNKQQNPIYYMVEPCDASFEALRSALEAHTPAFCIDLDVDAYPDIREGIPDPYAIQRIGFREYYEAYDRNVLEKDYVKSKLDQDRELYMARRLKELSFTYERILFVGGFFHVKSVLHLLDKNAFPDLKHAQRDYVEISTLTEESAREVMAECGWFSSKYEQARDNLELFPPDRQKLLYLLYKEASHNYMKETGNNFPGYHMRNLMKFARNYALVGNQLMPSLYEFLTCAKGCVDHNYAYEVWKLATEYPFLRNVDGLPEKKLTPQDLWKNSKILRFHMREFGKKERFPQRKRKDKANFRFDPPGPFGICSYPPEDLIVENFGEFLKKKGTQLLTEESARTIPFSTSIEDGIDTKETIRHWAEKKLYIKVKGKPPGGVGSVVVIFDEDKPKEGEPYHSKYPWTVSWFGEHQQESDMAFYATPIGENIVGPGISRSEYGGFMMTYPPRRLMDVWDDPDYEECKTKAEVLLMAAIDYAIKPLIVYVAANPPRSIYKSYAKRFGKRLVYLPIGQLSPITLNKIRSFHVLDSHDRRSIADEYIY